MPKQVGEPITTSDKSIQPPARAMATGGAFWAGKTATSSTVEPFVSAGCDTRSTVFRAFDDAEAIRERWTKLAESVNADLFGSFEWCQVWWKHFSKGRALEIHCYWVGEELVAVWPCFREKLRLGPFTLRVVRLLGSDHAGTRCWPLVRNDCVDRVVPHLLADLCAGDSWDVLQIGDLPGYFPQIDSIASALSRIRAGRVYLNRDYYPHAVFPIAETFEQYLEALSGNERNNIRKNDRRLAKSHVLRSRLVAPGDREPFLAEFFRWHDEYWHAQHELGFFTLWPGSREFHAEIARLHGDSGGPVLIEVKANDEPVGLVCAHRYNNRLHLFQAVRAPGKQFESYGPGRLLHCEAFRWCISQGIRSVDAMSGFYEYKRRLGAEFLGLTTLSMVRSNRSARVHATLFKWVLTLIDAFYFRGWLCRITPVLRRRFHLMNWKFLYRGMNEKFIRARFLLAALAKRENMPLSSPGVTDGD